MSSHVSTRVSSKRVSVYYRVPGLLACALLIALLYMMRTQEAYYRKQNVRRWKEIAANDLPQPIPSVSTVYDNFFPQAKLCGDEWRQNYSMTHRSIVNGEAPARYLVSVAVAKGTADRVTGFVTQFYLALLSGRAFTMVTYGDLPPFEAACNMPFFNWTHPARLPDGVINPLTTNASPPGNELDPTGRSYPGSGPVNSSTYYPVYLVNQDRTWGKYGSKLEFMANDNLTLYPADNPNISHVVSASNRGQTLRIMRNPYHKKQLESYGLTDINAFMCGFFTICAPNQAVQNLYQHYWEALNDTSVLSIGIMVRLGDHMFQGNAQYDENMGKKLVDTTGDVYFRCAAKLEQHFAQPGQQVVWYLMADSLAFRRAAKAKFGDKLLTDMETKIVHPDCRSLNPDACQQATMHLSLQHAIGQMLTFSKAQYHVYTAASGFGRLGAWASGRQGNLFEIHGQDCDPTRPTSPEQSSQTWSFVR